MAKITSIYDQDKNAPGYQREVERLYSMARHNEAAALRNAQQEIIDKLKNGISVDDVIKEYDKKS